MVARIFVFFTYGQYSGLGFNLTLLTFAITMQLLKCDQRKIKIYRFNLF
jgi:hypothetical protein